ncbi:RagB/SusD family nutrient uptake outer membrane protein [Flavisolibacter ginsenosidimutans]|uniref:RagB/SusD family nutrient uptake outer membrane protein n=2 Tax=Flavisolibacter ginsenosidimutans TaxID=661481 RepID=A0A5B8UPK0_9BACT|nr:RagB/SusD family nutrient uptake outer membrane protein [Flavisolibacter ginsenosidimutans]
MASVGGLSCKKVLDVQSYSSITDATAFATADRALLALNGVYDAAQSGGYNGGTEKRGYPFGSANIEQEDVRGEDVINVAAFYQATYQVTHNPSSANAVALWDNTYGMINKANVAIEGFRNAATSGVLTSAVATQYEAECRFLRAMGHHELVVMYARPYLDGNGSQLGVPYRDVANTSGSAVEQLRTIPRPKVSEDYQKILTDLDFAEANLPTGTAGTAVNTYRATKAAAIALKMRVKLHMGDYAGVILEGNKLVPATAPYISPIGGWTLTATPDGPFNATGGSNNSKENIFSIKNDANDAISVNGSLAGQFGPANLGGRGLVAISPIIWNNSGWKCDDKRRTLLYTSGTNNINGTSIMTIKYKDFTTKGDWAPQIRYAEVLLTLAEAEARQAAGVSQRAVDLVNAVRNRALANPATDAYTTASFTDKVALVKAILLERRIEFLAEGKRWGDISRLSGENNPNYSPGGVPAKASNGTQGASIYNCGGTFTPTQAAIPYSDYRFIWPIPADEITQNPIIVQNPGY